MSKIQSLIMKTKDILVEMMRDERGNVSVKPVLGFLLGLTLGVTLVINTIHPKEYQPSEGLIWGVVAVVVACIGADTADKYSVKNLVKGPKQENAE